MNPLFIAVYIGGKLGAFFLVMFLYCLYEQRKENNKKKNKKNDNDSGKDL